MPSIGGGSQYTPAASSSYGGNPNVYIPTNQPGADTQYQTLLNDLFRQYQQGATPGQQFAPLAAGTINNVAGNPYFDQALQGAQTGAGYGQEAAQGAFNFENFLNTIPSTLTGLAGQQLGYAGDLSNLGGQVAGYMPQVAGLAGQAAGYAPEVAGLARQAAGYAPQAAAYAPQVGAGIAPLQQAAGQVLNTAFDPRQAIYNQLLNQTQQESAVSNAQSGVYGPYAAGVSNDATRNLNLDWQNQQLTRQTQGLGAASGAYGQAGALGSEAAGIYGTASNILNQAGGLFGQAGGLDTAAGNLYGTAGRLGGEAGNLYQGAGSLTGQAADIYGRQIPSEISSSLGIGGQAANLASSSAGLPYGVYQGQQANTQGALTTGLPQLNQQYAVPQSLFNNLDSYLGLGQSASQLGFQGGGLGFNQNQQQLGNLGALFNAGVGGGGLSSLLYGSQGGGLSNAIGLGQGGLIGSIFGGGGGAAGPADFLLPGTDTALQGGFSLGALTPELLALA